MSVNGNSIIVFDFKPYDDIIIPGDLKKEFSTRSKKVLLEGYCDKCRKKKVKNFSLFNWS